MTPNQQDIADADDTDGTTPEACSECDECQFSWYDNNWHCELTADDIILDNDIFITINDNCPKKSKAVD